jgi:Xaa-Pro aminopeptidase
MNLRPWRPAVLLAFFPLLASAETTTSSLYQSDFPPAEFQARWKTVFDKIGPDAVAILQGAPKANGFIVPRQSNEFYYLSGIETPHAYLVLNGRDRKVTVLLPPRDERLERAEGKILSADDADLVKSLTGVDTVASTRTMTEEWMRQIVRGFRPVIYTPFTPAEGNAQCRGELQSANAAIALDFWDGRPSQRPTSCSCCGPVSRALTCATSH